MKNQSRFDTVVENFKTKFPDISDKAARAMALAYISRLDKIVKNSKPNKEK